MVPLRRGGSRGDISRGLTPPVLIWRWQTDVRSRLWTGSTPITFPRWDLNQSEKELNRINALLEFACSTNNDSSSLEGNHLAATSWDNNVLFSFFFFLSSSQTMFPNYFCDATTFALVQPCGWHLQDVQRGQYLYFMRQQNCCDVDGWQYSFNALSIFKQHLYNHINKTVSPALFQDRSREAEMGFFCFAKHHWQICLHPEWLWLWIP